MYLTKTQYATPFTPIPSYRALFEGLCYKLCVYDYRVNVLSILPKIPSQKPAKETKFCTIYTNSLNRESAIQITNKYSKCLIDSAQG